MRRSVDGAPANEVKLGGAPLAAIYMLQLIVVAPILIVTSGRDAYGPLAVNLGIALALLAWFEMRRVGHPLTPAGVVAIGGIFIFALRPLTVSSSGFTSPGALADARPFVAGTVDAAAVALGQVTLFYAIFGLVYFLMLGRPAPRVMPRMLLSGRAVRRAAILLFVVMLFASGCALLLIHTSGGFVAHFSGVSVRSSFLAGRYYLTLSYIPFTVGLVIYVVARRFSGLKEWDALAIIAGVVLCAVGFATGGRGPLLLGVIIPILILKQTGPSRFSPRTLVVIGLGLLAGAMVMSLFLREGTYDEGASIRALQSDPVGTLLQRVTSGAETRQFDSLILLNERDAVRNVPVLLGSTYAAVPTWFIPGDLVPWKDGGANTWFTRTYVPRFYYPDRIETSISAIGEAYANFRYAGIVVVAALLAVAAVKLSVTRSGDGFTKTAVASLLTPLFFSFVRGDAFQNVSTAVLILICVALFTAVVGGTVADSARTGRSRRTPRRSPVSL